MYNLDGGGGCRVVIYATRLAIHPPTTASGINPSCPISPERFHISPLPSPPTFQPSLSLCVYRSPPHPPHVPLSSSFPLVVSSLFFDFSPSLVQFHPSQVPPGLSRPLYFPLSPAIRFYRSTVMVVSAKSTGASVTSTRASLSLLALSLQPTTTTIAQCCTAVGGSP